MEYIKKFESFNDIEDICRKYGIENYTINEDGSIDVNGDVDLSHKGLTKLPLKFDKVDGHFYCSSNQLAKSKIELFNDYDIIRDGQSIVLDRLNAFLDDIGKSPVSSVKGYKII